MYQQHVGDTHDPYLQNYEFSIISAFPAKKMTLHNFQIYIQSYSYDQRLEYVDIDFNVPYTPIVGLGQ